LSKAVNKPVKIAWTRQEEFQFDLFRPAMLIELTAGLDGSGNLAAWQYDLYSTAYFPEGAKQPTRASAEAAASVLDFYAVPNARTTFYQSVAPLPPHFWRANGSPVNGLAREAAIDMLAETAGTDPVSFRTTLLQNNPRLLAVMNAAVQKANWKPGVGSTGRGFGLGLSWTDGTYVAEVAQVAVDKASGKVSVKHVDTAIDCGLVINPEAVRCQVEGSVVMHGVSSTLKEQIMFSGGRVTNTAFAQYNLLTMSETPTVDTVFVEDKKQPMEGIGEPAVAATTPAIANAIYDAVGVRLWDLPFTPDKVLAAISTKT
ncbi:MAG TPA: molybdopterin cofactor-binding domain-containing protein, partial [Chloroflexota bacterium]|nr:molybdopterin cofactor-binding domain-containing protein [Chloroflexota bacterium]